MMSNEEHDAKEPEIAYSSAGDTDKLVTTKSSNPLNTITWIIAGVLMGLLVLVTAALIGVSIGLGITKNSSSGGSSSVSNNVCITEGCVQASAQITAALNRSVNPCDDFYQFACGNWLKTTGVPSGFDTYNNIISKLSDASNVALGKLFEADNDGGVAGVRKMLDFFKSCSDVNTIESLGVGPVRDLIRQTGGWSLVGIPESEPWSINSTAFQNEKLYGSDAFFNYKFTFDIYNSSQYVLGMEQSGRDETSITFRNETIDLIVDVLSLINPVEDNTAYVNAANAIVDFETFTVGASFATPGNLTETFVAYTVDQLQSDIFPQLDWRGLIQAYYRLADPSYVATGNERIVVETPNYFRNLSRMYHDLTDPSIIQNYAKWRFIKGLLPYFNKALEQPFITFTQATNPGTPISNDRTLMCTQIVQNAMPIALSRLFTEQALISGTKETLSMTTEMIRDAFKERLQANTWLDDFSRQRCIEKADAIVKMVAYPDQILDNDYVNGFYDRLTIDPSDFLGNGLRIMEVNVRAGVQRFFNGVNRLAWPTDIAKPTDVNAFYSPNLNQIIILEGILSPPAFNAKFPDYINFGAIGTSIGHEISHGFDNSGQQFNKDGNFIQWWSDEGISRFKSRLPCFIDQYSGYNIEGYQVDGQRTLGENIADLGGVNAAFRAHRNRVEKGGTTQTLPSLDYNIDQLFFISYAQLWCTLYTPSGAQRALTTDVHSPGQARVLGPLLNSADFAEVFNCPVGSRMNPVNRDKCELW